MESKSTLNKLSALSLILFIGGILTWLGYAVVLGKPAWGSVLTSFVYVASVTQGALAIVVIMRLTSIRWGAPLYRLGSSVAVSFIPFGIALTALIIFAGNSIFYWANDVEHSLWYSYPFFIARQSVFFFFVYLVAARINNYSINSITLEKDDVPQLNSKLLNLGAVLILSLIAHQTLVSWDLAMISNKHWADTMHSVIFMIASLYGGIAFLIVLAFISRRLLKADIFSDEFFENSGKVLLAISITWSFFWYSQYFNIWFVNIPEETEPIFLRIYEHYRPFFLMSLVMMSGIPFFGLIFSKIRKSINAVFGIAVLVLIGIWLERYLLVVPSLDKEHKIVELFVLNPVNIAFTFAILGGVMMLFFNRIKKHPHIIPEAKTLHSDPLLVDPRGWQ